MQHHHHHPPHPPPNFCCQLAPREIPGVITIFPVKPHPPPKTDRFWDPVRRDAATRPPTPPRVVKIDDPTLVQPLVVHLSESESDSPTSLGSMTESPSTDFQKGVKDQVRKAPKRVRRRRSKNYSCSFCSSAFERPSSLSQHLRRHTGEKPFKCPSCTKTFSIASNARRHTKGCKGSSPNFEFTSMPSPPSTPPHRPLKLEIADAIHGKGRSWEVCADEPSHRLLTLEEEDEEFKPLIPSAVATTSSSLKFPGTRSHPSAQIKTADSVVLHRRQGLYDGAPPRLPSVSSTLSLSSAPFDWRVGHACRGDTGTRYRIHNVEHPIPVPVLPPEVDVKKVKLEPDDDGINLSPDEQMLPVSSNNNSTIHKRHVIIPPVLFRPRPLHAMYNHAADRRLPTPNPSIPNGGGIGPFKASPYAPLGLSSLSPFYPSSRRWSIDSGASSSVSTTSTVYSSHESVGPFTRNP